MNRFHPRETLDDVARATADRQWSKGGESGNTRNDASTDGARVWMTTEEAASYARCHEETIHRAGRAGTLRRHPFGVRRWRFKRHDIDDWLMKGASTRAA